MTPPRTQSPLLLFCLRAAAPLGEAIAKAIKQPLSAHEERDFEDGEHKTRPLVGIWFFTPSDIFGIDGRAMNALVNAGALVSVTPILAMSECFRIARYANIPIAIVLAIMVWLADGALPATATITTLIALALITLTFTRGSIRQ